VGPLKRAYIELAHLNCVSLHGVLARPVTNVAGGKVDVGKVASIEVFAH
jgi:hypothetical protein